MSAATRPPTLVIPPFADTDAFGPTGTPRVAAMPLYSPGWSSPPSAAQLADPRDPCHCPRHDPAAGFTRNTYGLYGSAVPACSGCRQGDRDAEELAAAARVTALETSLRVQLRNDHPTSETRATATELYIAVLDMEALTTIILTPADYARRAIRIWETTASLHSALVRYRGLTTAEALREVRTAFLLHLDACDRFTPTTYTGSTVAQLLMDPTTMSG